MLSVLGFPPLPTYPELPPPSNLPNPIPPAHAFPPHWPWNLTSADLLTLSQETLRLPIITFPAETVEGW